MEIDHQQSQPMEVDEDHISTLPNSVLTLILSSLNIREAVATSVLSKRWIHLWKTLIISLTFDAHNMLHTHSHSHSHMLCLERYIVKMKRTLHFIHNVDYYLSRITEVQKIDKLKVCFTFRNNRYRGNLDRWIRFALQRNVEDIDLILLEEDHFSAPIEGPLYVFPCDLLAGNSSLKRLRLAHCTLAPLPHCSISSAFNTLTSLELHRVDLVSVDHFRNLLWHCRNIESLSLSECENIEYLRIEHPLCQKLRYLNVNDCPELKAIEFKGINNVETLEYKGRIIGFLFNDAPKA